jgi:integrase/recombinase XerD
MQNDLQKLFEEYARECEFSARLSKETVRGYKNVFSLFLKIMPEVSSVELLSGEMLNEFFRRIETRPRMISKNVSKTGVKSSTIKTQYSKLNVFFKWLERKGHIDEHPLKNIKPPRVFYEDFKKLEDGELARIYAAATLHSSNSFIAKRDTLMISLLFYCGLRKGEFISLLVTDVDLYKKEITIRGETSKSKRTRILPMNLTLALHLQDYFKERNSRGLKTEKLIASNKGDSGLSRQGLKHWVNSMRNKSGVRFHLHQFRHTFACKLDQINVSAFKIQKLLGHSHIGMTMKYVRSEKTSDMWADINKICI